MELELFNFIDETIKYYELKKPSFTYAEGQLVSLFKEVAGESSDTLLSVKSRVKSSESLREKLIRNRFYLNCTTPEEALRDAIYMGYRTLIPGELDRLTETSTWQRGLAMVTDLMRQLMSSSTSKAH